MMDLEFDTACPGCNRKFKIKAKEMAPGKKKTCPQCKSEITFAGDDMRKAQKALDDLEKTMKNLFK
jgi:rRNA maturation endonuclease Nob1